jgi:hypothetical protein
MVSLGTGKSLKRAPDVSIIVIRECGEASCKAVLEFIRDRLSKCRNPGSNRTVVRTAFDWTPTQDKAT